MLTKYVLTLGSTDYDVPDEDLKNWDDIAFTLKRSDYSGVMRSFSTEFVFAGGTKDRLWAAYLSSGFRTTAKIAVYTINDRHGYEKQYEAALDFSTLETDEGTLTINAMDNSLAALIKAKKSQKYEFAVSSFSTSNVSMERLEIKNRALYEFISETNPAGIVSVSMNSSASQILSTEYFELTDEVRGGQENSFFATCKKRGARMVLEFSITAVCPFGSRESYVNTGSFTTPGSLQVYTNTPGDGGGNIRTVIATPFDNDLRHRLIRGSVVNMQIGGDTAIYGSVQQLAAAASSGYHPEGSFGVVGSQTNPSSEQYWTNCTVYELVGGSWVAKGTPSSYYQERAMSAVVYVNADQILLQTQVALQVAGGDFMLMAGTGTMTVSWSDPAHEAVTCRAIRPVALLSRLVNAISPGTTVTIEADSGGLLADTWIVPGEELRKIYDAKIYTSFKDFADWMETVFGYTYSIDGNILSFVHRSSVFTAEVSKDLPSVADVKFSVVDDLIYSQVEAGYSKKDYGEIDGRLEKNFTNYYATEYSLTDKKLSLISKYRSDAYGIEFTMRKSESDTKDDKADEDVFFISALASGNTLAYTVGNNDLYAPDVCVVNNGAFLAAFGNGAPVRLNMTSSDGNNPLENIDLAGSLFTCGELQFTTEDPEPPADVNAMVRLSFGGYEYSGFIKEAKARFGRVSGMEYTIIIKSITPTS